MDNYDKTKEQLINELQVLQKEFYYLNAIKQIDNGKRIQLEQELAIAHQEIALQNEEKEKRAAELIIANLELKFQNEEKAKRAAELVIANIELVFQHKEKAMRSAELVIANKELSFQNDEKGKRAAELIIALANAEDFENKFKQIAENIDEVFWLRTDSEMIYVSPSFEKIWGVPCETIYENPQIFTEKIHPEDKPVVQEIFHTNEFKEKGIFEYSYRIIRADNQVRWINAKTVPIVDDSGQVIKRVGIASDITEKHQSVQELFQSKEKAEKSERKFRSYIENAPDGIFVVDNSGRYIEINNSIVRILGYSESEILNLSINDLLAKESLEDGLAHFKNLFEKGNANSDLLHKHKNGTKRWLTINAVKLSSENSIGFVKDITERIQVDEELIKAKDRAEESDKLKSAFLANMSHEIRTPMNGILGFAELLKEPELSGEKQQEFISIIEKSGARMLNIINDIICISKIESGTVETYISKTNINEHTEYVYELLKPDADKKKLKIIYNNGLSDKESIIKTDVEKFISILSNLVKNAIKYTDQGSIEFGYILKTNTTALEAAELEFYIKDTGIGILKDRQEAIFERFIQAHIVDKMARQGAGLGLAISKAYIAVIGGRIWVESEVGKGSTFYFTIPYNAEPKQKIIIKNDIPANIETHVKNLKILIAEDDETSEKLISMSIEKFSKEILKVSTGAAAINVCRNNPDIDLILMDIQMTDLNGYEATRQIRQFNKDVIIIAQTAFGQSGDREKSIEAGCNDYISKPIYKAVLQALIKKYFKN